MGLIDIIKPLSSVLSSAVNKSQQHQEKKSWESLELNRGLLGEEQICYAWINYHAVWCYIFMSNCAQRNDEERNALVSCFIAGISSNLFLDFFDVIVVKWLVALAPEIWQNRPQWHSLKDECWKRTKDGTSPKLGLKAKSPRAQAQEPGSHTMSSLLDWFPSQNSQ